MMSEEMEIEKGGVSVYMVALHGSTVMFCCLYFCVLPGVVLVGVPFVGVGDGFVVLSIGLCCWLYMLVILV